MIKHAVLYLDVAFMAIMPVHLTSIDTGLKIAASILVIATNVFVLIEKIKKRK